MLAEERLVDYLDWPKVKDTIAYMNSADTSKHLTEFFDYTAAIDKSRNENLLDHIPEFEKYETHSLQ